MKKAIALVWICLLCAGLLLYSLLSAPAPQAPDSTAAPTQASSSPTDPPEPTEPAPSTQPTEPAPTEPPAPTQELRISLPGEPGTWDALAADYLQSTGIELVFTKTDPTLVVADQASLRGYAAYVDLGGTTANAMLYDRELAYILEEKVCGLPVQMDCYGLICNEQLLAANGMTVDQITDFATLAQAARLIASRGTPAFATMDMDRLAELLAALPCDPRAFLDLYIETTGERLSAPQIDGRSEFLNNQAVFYLGNAADYQALSSMGEHQLGILPLYMGSVDKPKQTLLVACREYVCINAEAAPEDQALALDFLDYLVTKGADGTTPLDLLGVATPYRSTSYTANGFEQKLHDDIVNDGCWCMVCLDVAKTPVGLSDALLAYISFPTDEGWDKVTKYLMIKEETL